MTNGSEHAFPHLHLDSSGVIRLEGGLSKTEWFAGMALSRVAEKDFNILDPFEASKKALIIADMMIAVLAEREAYAARVECDRKDGE